MTNESHIVSLRASNELVDECSSKHAFIFISDKLKNVFSVALDKLPPAVKHEADPSS